MKTKLTVSLTIIILLIFVPIVPASAEEPISVTVNGEQVIFPDQTPVIVDGHTLVPVRGLFEKLGFEVTWNGETRQAILTRNRQRIVITVDNDRFNSCGMGYSFDVPAQIINGRIMIPLRAVLQTVGYTVGWDSDTRTVLIFNRETLQFGGLSWRVLEIQDNYALIIANDTVANRQFHYTLESDTAITWENSDIRQYLNTDFYSRFTDEEQARIRPTTVTTAAHETTWFRTRGGNDTIDKIFLLSIEELDYYFAGDGNRMTRRNEIEVSWWLRCTHAERNGAANMFHDHGGIFDFRSFTALSGVRPALWLNLEH
jgi:hypothetical protein